MSHELATCQRAFLFGQWGNSEGCRGEWYAAIRADVKLEDVNLLEGESPEIIAAKLEIPLEAASRLSEVLLVEKISNRAFNS